MKVLVLLLYYERPNMVRNALESLLKQKYKNWELAAIDDGSDKPLRPVLKDVFRDQTYKLYETKDSTEAKLSRGGSLIGQYLNQAMSESNAELALLLCDDDALEESYLDNLVSWFSEHPKSNYCFSDVILFDPYTEKPERPFSHNYAFYKDSQVYKTKHFLNHELATINPVNRLDASQVAWRLSQTKSDGIMFPFPQTTNLDSSFYEQLVSKYGECPRTGIFGQYKASFSNTLSARLENSDEVYRVQDLPPGRSFNVAILTHLYYETGWDQVKPFLLNLELFNNLKISYFFNLTGPARKANLKSRILKILPQAHVSETDNKGRDIGGKLVMLDQWMKLGSKADYLLFLHDKKSPHLQESIGASWFYDLVSIITPLGIQASIAELQNPRVGIVGSKKWIKDNTETGKEIINRYRNIFGFRSQDRSYIGGTIFWAKADPFRDFFSRYSALDIREELEEGNPYEPSKTHAWERLFAHLVAERGLKISGVTTCDFSVDPNMPADWDELGYLAQNQDVLPGVQNQIFKSGWDHYQKHGMAEGRRYSRLRNILAVSASAEVSKVGPPDWDEDVYLQSDSGVAEAVKVGVFQSGWDHYRRAGQFERRPYISKSFNSDGLTNYIIATWSGSRRGPIVNPISFLDSHIKALKTYRHQLSQITIAVPDNPQEPQEFRDFLMDLPSRLGTAKVEILRRPNLGQSYGSYCDTYLKYRQSFKYYIFIEDDYLPVQDDFDLILIRQLELQENCGFLASLVYDWQGRPHAAVSNGIAKSQTLENICQKFKCLPHGEAIGVDYTPSSQVKFSWAFLDVGTSLGQLSNFQVPYNHLGELRIFQGDHSKPLLVPVHFLKNLGYSSLESAYV